MGEFHTPAARREKSGHYFYKPLVFSRCVSSAQCLVLQWYMLCVSLGAYGSDPHVLRGGEDGSCGRYSSYSAAFDLRSRGLEKYVQLTLQLLFFYAKVNSSPEEDSRPALMSAH